MNHKGLPTETSVDSVIWYLLSINPFLDYAWEMPSRHRLLMLDWAKDEDVLFPTIAQGKEGYPYLPWEAGAASDDGPKAKRCQRSGADTGRIAKGPVRHVSIPSPPRSSAP